MLIKCKWRNQVFLWNIYKLAQSFLQVQETGYKRRRKQRVWRQEKRVEWRRKRFLPTGIELAGRGLIAYWQPSRTVFPLSPHKPTAFTHKRATPLKWTNPLHYVSHVMCRKNNFAPGQSVLCCIVDDEKEIRDISMRWMFTIIVRNSNTIQDLLFFGHILIKSDYPISFSKVTFDDAKWRACVMFFIWARHW